MVDSMHYTVRKKYQFKVKNLNAYLFESDGGGWFSAVRSPDDVCLEVGDVIKHYSANQWRDKEEKTLTIDPDLKCSTYQEADAKFAAWVDEDS
ncbi:hypothetical protein CYR55_05445 [Chimaeribacter californicus]|uniref:Uncharacterized protein n=1 Tax=Chimaeribacter californicus TaxID=2060067 RepID=A0A2N5EDV6_9GAMM|nr:hypothetical protein [Chimaeribacter californicus]PLR40725.1 hypothetical protein CYR55_05445 [Chimaeribacter californicus]